MSLRFGWCWQLWNCESGTEDRRFFTIHFPRRTSAPFERKTFSASCKASTIWDDGRRSAFWRKFLLSRKSQLTVLVCRTCSHSSHWLCDSHFSVRYPPRYTRTSLSGDFDEPPDEEEVCHKFCKQTSLAPRGSSAVLGLELGNGEGAPVVSFARVSAKYEMHEIWNAYQSM